MKSFSVCCQSCFSTAWKACSGRRSMPCGQSASCANFGEAETQHQRRDALRRARRQSPSPACRRRTSPAARNAAAAPPARLAACASKLRSRRPPRAAPAPRQIDGQVSHSAARRVAQQIEHTQVHAPAMQADQRQAPLQRLVAPPSMTGPASTCNAAASCGAPWAGTTAATASSSASTFCFGVSGRERHAQALGARRHGGMANGARPRSPAPSTCGWRPGRARTPGSSDGWIARGWTAAAAGHAARRRSRKARDE